MRYLFKGTMRDEIRLVTVLVTDLDAFLQAPSSHEVWVQDDEGNQFATKKGAVCFDEVGEG